MYDYKMEEEEVDSSLQELYELVHTGKESKAGLYTLNITDSLGSTRTESFTSSFLAKSKAGKLYHSPDVESVTVVNEDGLTVFCLKRIVAGHTRLMVY